MRAGTDIVYIPRIKKLIENKSFLEKIFHPSELKNLKPEHLAGVLAAKEAFFKAINQKPKWLDVEIVYQKTSRPKLILSNKYKLNTDLSITHDKDYAVGFVIIK
ncbi:holo-ACP synthase [Candidatus Woesearchaeota archaeon]|nr:holo-ACP synthase [Candidatus Woesearchaeota archaeon]